MTDIKFISFDKLSGTLVVSNGSAEFAVEVPVEDGKFISGPALLRYISGLIPASEPRDTSTVGGADAIAALCVRQPDVYEPPYTVLRAKAYPPVTDYLDAVVKGDQTAIDQYIDACLAVKARFPKPEAVEVSAEVLRQRRDL